MLCINSFKSHLHLYRIKLWCHIRAEKTEIKSQSKWMALDCYPSSLIPEPTHLITLLHWKAFMLFPYFDSVHHSAALEVLEKPCNMGVSADFRDLSISFPMRRHGLYQYLDYPNYSAIQEEGTKSIKHLYSFPLGVDSIGHNHKGTFQQFAQSQNIQAKNALFSNFTW